MLVPKLRFKREDGTDYPEWENQKLSAVSSRVTRKNKGNITDIPLTIASLYGLVDQREYFKKTIASQNMEGYYLLHNGEFAYNKSYSKGFDFGAIKRLDRYDCGALSTLYICFAVNNKVDSDFMTHYFDSQKWNKEVSIRCAEGARNHGLLNISTDDFFDIDMTLPTDLEEQQKIADFLSTVDEVIAQSEAEVQNLEQQKKAAMQKIFSQEVRFKREDGTEYPKWENKPLSEICDVRDGTHDSPKYVGEGFPLVTSKNLTKYGTIDFTNVNFIKEDDYNMINVRSKVDIGDILFGMIGTIGKPVLVNSVGFAIKNVALLKPLYINNAYLFYYLQSDDVEKAFRYKQTGNTQKFIALSTIRQIKIVVPYIEEQQKIADFLSTYDEAIHYAKQELDKWKELKKGLLQQMFV